MAKETKKYVVAGTDEEVLLGDVLSVEMVKDFKDGRTLTREVEFKITEETIPDALELGIIEEVEDEEELIDFEDGDIDGFKEAVALDIDDIRETLDYHAKLLKALKESVETIKEVLTALKDNHQAKSEKKTASSGKKK